MLPSLKQRAATLTCLRMKTAIQKKIDEPKLKQKRSQLYQNNENRNQENVEFRCFQSFPYYRR